ncbi:MAG: hypothetical protein NVV74_11135 [Magnetospirillum sp.]|nr:hypothetical protein [Magnetospirillum sp.]
MRARVVHAIPGRVRIRLTDVDPTALLSLRQRLSTLPGVQEVRANPRTGSLLLRGDAVMPQSLTSTANGLGFPLDDLPEVRPLVDHFLDGFDAADVGLRRATGGQLDIASVAMLALLGTAVVQIVRGRFAAPAITILWYAASTVLMARSVRRAPG